MAFQFNPKEITYEDVLRAIEGLQNGQVMHEFHDSEKYDLIYEAERFPPKAVFGIAARRIAGFEPKPADFKGGEGSICFKTLRDLGFTIERKQIAEALDLKSLVVGQEYNRRSQIHASFGGQEQSGISTPRDNPVILLFTADTGGQFGYSDHFRDDGVFLYTGQGQKGDMEFRAGNLAIRNSVTEKKQLLVFEQTRNGYVRFVGFAKYLGHHTEQRPDIDGKLRNAIVFELEVSVIELPVEPLISSEDAGNEANEKWVLPKTLSELRIAALQPQRENLSPKQRTALVHYRAEAVKKYVLKRSKGICEGCKAQAPFLNRSNNPYLEPHHTTRRADGGPDLPAHVIALCPNCHRRVHYGFDGDHYNAQLIECLKLLEP